MEGWYTSIPKTLKLLKFNMLDMKKINNEWNQLHRFLENVEKKCWYLLLDSKEIC